MTKYSIYDIESNVTIFAAEAENLDEFYEKLKAAIKEFFFDENSVLYKYLVDPYLSCAADQDFGTDDDWRKENLYDFYVAYTGEYDCIINDEAYGINVL